MNRRSARGRLLAIAVALVVTGCGGAARLPLPDDAVVHFGNTIAAAVVIDGSVQVEVAVPNSTSPSVITSGAARVGTASVRLLTYGGETREEWNTFVYGTAPYGAATVSLSWPADAVGGRVSGGAWLIVLRNKDVTPDLLHWQFRAADGSVIASGDGILTP